MSEKVDEHREKYRKMMVEELENDHRILKEAVGAFCGFMDRGAGNTITHRIPPAIARRLLDYVDQFRKLTE